MRYDQEEILRDVNMVMNCEYIEEMKSLYAQGKELPDEVKQIAEEADKISRAVCPAFLQHIIRN